MKKTRKYFAILLALVMALTAFPLSGVTASAATSGDFFYKVLSEEDKTCEITGCTGYATALVIPSELDGYTVTSIGDAAFSWCESLTSVDIPDSVTSIGDYAFSWCESLTSVDIPDSVTSIGEMAFYNCTSLTNITVATSNPNYSSENGVLFNKDKTTLIQYPAGKTDISYTIPDSVTSIGESAFADCDSLTSISIPDSVTSIGDSAFYSCNSLASVDIPDSVTSIGDSAFEFCDSLTSINLPNSVTSIGDSAFSNCASLPSVTIPDSVTSVGYNAFAYCDSLISVDISNSMTSTGNGTFAYCDSLTSINLPNSVTSIGDSAFSNCDSLTSINLPNSVTSIGESAFADCDSLTSISIPDSVTSIAEGAFWGCTSLTSVDIPDSVTSIGDSAFRNCDSLTSISIPDSVTRIRDYAFFSCDSLTSISIPDSVTSIGDYAFENCYSLTSINLPNSVTSIGDSAFAFCESLMNITVANSNPNYCSENGVLFNKDKTTLIQYPIGKTDISYTIPDSVTSIGGYAFARCSSLTSMTIGNNVTSIGYYAFFGCDSLASVTLGNSVTRIRDSAFASCFSLTSVTIPSSVTRIGIDAFSWCDSLITIYGYAGSYAETYAHGHNIPFVDITTGLVTSGTLARNNVNLSLFDKAAFTSGNLNQLTDTYKLSNVLLTAGGTQQEVNSTAVLTSAQKNQTVTLSKTDYQNYVLPAEVVSSWFGSDSLAARNIYMAKDKKDGKPYIAGAYARKSSKSTAYTDLQSDELTVMAETKYDVILAAETRGSGVDTYVLSQDDAHKLTSSSGKFSSKELASTFAAGKDVYAYVKTTDGKTSEPVKLNMQITKMALSGDTFSLLGKDGPSIKFSDDVPLIGGATVSLDGFTFPIGIEVEGNRFKISFGVDVFSASQGSDGTTKKEGVWDAFKQSVYGLQNSNESSGEKLKKYKNFVNTFTPGQSYLEKGKNFDASFLGYAEGYFVNGSPVYTSFCGEVAAKFSFSYTQQGTIWVVPVYAYVKAGATAAVQLKSVRSLPDSDVPFDFGLALELEPELSIGGGVGVKGAVSGGLYGKGSLPFYNDFSAKHTRVQLSGEIGIEGEFFCFNGKKTVLDGTLTLYDNYYGKAKTGAVQNVLQRITQTELANAGTKDDTVTTVMPRDYAEHTSDWLGYSFFRKFYASSPSASDGLTVKELQTSVFKNSQSQLIALDNGKMMAAWIEDDSARDTYNRMRLVYSVYENGSWSKPLAVDDDGTNDAYPSLATDGETVYITWQNLNDVLTEADADSIDAILKSSEICLAKYNASENQFEAVQTLTQNDKYDYAPTLAVENAQAVLYWQQSADNNLSAAGSNTVYRYDTASDKTAAVKSGLNYMPDMEAAFVNGKDEVSFSMDTDGNLSTTADIYAYTLSDGVLTQQTPANEALPTADFAVTYGILDGQNTLFFADSTDVYYKQNGEVKKVFSSVHGINGDLQILENGSQTVLIWTEVSDAGTELWSCSYSDGAWTEPIQFSNQGALLHDVSAVYQNGVIHGVFDRTARTLENGEYVSGQTDFCYLTFSDYTDLEASLISVDESAFVPGEEVQIPVYLKNNGTEDITEAEFTLTDTLGSSQTIRQAVSLPSGAEAFLNIPYLVPQDYQKMTLTISASLPGASETTTENNTDSLELGYADIATSEISVNDIGEYFVLTAVVQNRNPVAVQQVQVHVRADDEQGQTLDSTTLGDLQPGEMRTVQYIVAKSAVEFDAENLAKICFAAETTSEESNTVNNISYAVIVNKIAAPSVTPGDVNGDGTIDAADAVMIQRYDSGLTTLTDEQLAAADVNADGLVDAADAVKIQRYDAGLIASL